jgi:hypothetical protein
MRPDRLQRILSVVDAISTMSLSVSSIGGHRPDPALTQLYAMLHRVRALGATAPATTLSIEDRLDLRTQAERLADTAAGIATSADFRGLSRLEGQYVVLEMGASGSEIDVLLAAIETRHAELVAASRPEPREA